MKVSACALRFMIEMYQPRVMRRRALRLSLIGCVLGLAHVKFACAVPYHAGNENTLTTLILPFSRLFGARPCNLKIVIEIVFQK